MLKIMRNVKKDVLQFAIFSQGRWSLTRFREILIDLELKSYNWGSLALHSAEF